MGYKGWAIFAGDMICNADIAELWKLRDPSKAVMVTVWLLSLRRVLSGMED